jgi:transposase
MTAPGVGPIVGLTYVAAIDDPARFSSSKAAGAHCGMTPKKYQSGEIGVTGRISKMGDMGARGALRGRP